jgi:cell surface protein SprA
VNLWENSEAPDYYTMPPGVSAPRQLNNPDPTVDIQMNEQSINIGVRNLRYGQERMATRIYRAQDIFSYKKMKLFFHGDGSMPDKITSGSVPKAYCFIRFGIDSSNYYEYRRPLTRGWQDIEIDLAQLTSFKQVRDTSNVYGRQIFPVQGDDQAYFAIKGNPILTRVSFFGLGIANPAENYPNELTTSLWVDELRLIDPESSADWAAIANADIKLADLGTINASVQKYQPNFHQLEERFGNRVDAVNWTFTTQGNLEKLAPKIFSAMRLPIAYTHAEFMQTPEYQASNDVNLDQAANAAEKTTYENLIRSGVDIATATAEAQAAKNNIIKSSQTLRIQDSWGLTGVKLGIPIKYWLIDETLNKLTLGYNYSQEFLRSPIYKEQFNWLWQLNAGYSTNIPDLLTLRPLSWLDKDFPVLGTYRNWKINFLPSALAASINLNRRRQTEQSRFLDFASPVLRNFSARKQASFSWKVSEEGLLSPIIDYQFNTNSTLSPIETDEFGNNLPGSEVFKRMFAHGVYLGVDNLHNQTVTINFKPLLPVIKGSNRFITMSGSYSSQYTWTDPMQSDPTISDAAKSVSVNSNLRFNLSLQPGAMADNWFGKLNMTDAPIPPSKGGLVAGPEESAKLRAEQLKMTLVGKIFKKTGQILRLVFLEWDKADIIMNQQTSSINSGVYGTTGLGNFWRGVAFMPSTLNNGTSFAYQMGLIANPHGGFNLVGLNRFPWFGFSTYTGLRPQNAILTDNFRQTTSIELKGNRKLWKGATMEINFKTEEGYNKNQTVTTDELGVPSFSAILANASIKRTYLTCPSIFGWNPANNSIDHIVALFDVQKKRILASSMDTMQKNVAIQEALSESFFQGLRAISITKGAMAKIFPAPNWKIRWEGLENFPLWKDIVKRMSLEHSYTSNYTEEVQITDIGKSIQKQSVQYGFQPLIGLSASLDETKLKGAATGQLRWSTTTTYSFNGVTKTTIQGISTDELTFQGSYTMKGFEFPLFGIILKNDFELSLMASYKRNFNSTYDVSDSSSYTGANKNGRTLSGNTQIILEPRARYNVSNVVTASAFLRYEGTINQGDANAGYSTFQLGVDLRISLSGGR